MLICKKLVYLSKYI
uniref:Uncharacterized protein n=1 Tax=Anguilla anguilla TaxID=7936 RepID=A0A0E9TGI6_ANGAN